MRYELTDYEWVAIKPMLPRKPRGVPRVGDRPSSNKIVCQCMHCMLLSLGALMSVRHPRRPPTFRPPTFFVGQKG